MICLSQPIDNNDDVCEWLGVTVNNCLHFAQRETPIEVSLLPFTQIERKAKLNAMTQQVITCLEEETSSNSAQKDKLLVKKIAVFVPDEVYLKQVAFSILSWSAN